MKFSRFNKILFLGIVFVLFFFAGHVDAQCALCRASAESNLNTGGNIALGLNNGILYLMALPYIIFIAILALFFKKELLTLYHRLIHKLGLNKS